MEIDVQIAVLIIAIIGFIMSFAVVGIFPSAFALVLGLLTMVIKKNKMKTLGKVETIMGIVIAILGILVSVFLYLGATKGFNVFGDWFYMLADKVQFWKNWF